MKRYLQDLIHSFLDSFPLRTVSAQEIDSTYFVSFLSIPTNRSNPRLMALRVTPSRGCTGDREDVD